MRVLFTSLRNTSHFLPLVPFVDACRRRGHDVAVAAPPDLAERVAATGAAFFPFAHPGDAGLRPIWARLHQADPEQATRIVVRDIFAGVLAATALPGVLQTMEQWRPAIVVRESQEYAALIAAEKLSIPHLHVAITAKHTEAEAFPLAAPSVDAHRRGLGLAPDPLGERISGEPAITLFPLSLEDPKHALAPVSRFRAARKKAPPLPDWWGAEAGQKPFVYVTLGTVTGSMEQMRSSYRVALGAVRDLPLRVLLTIGSDLPMEALGEVPSNVHVERFVPQEDVLPHARAVLCHGGSGSVVGALTAGVPMVVAPLFADQMANAERVAAIGAGLAMPQRTESAEALRHALTVVLEDASFRVVAQRVAAEIAGLPLTDEAALVIERLASGAPA